MSQVTTSRWEDKRTDETRALEALLRKHFPRTDAYRYNSASIRVRVIDECFEGKSDAKRDAMVEKILKQLPPETQEDIMNLITVTPNELNEFSTNSMVNFEFDNPSPSTR